MPQSHRPESRVTRGRPLSAAFFMLAFGIAAAASVGCSTSGGEGQGGQGGSGTAGATGTAGASGGGTGGAGVAGASGGGTGGAGVAGGSGSGSGGASGGTGGVSGGDAGTANCTTPPPDGARSSGGRRWRELHPNGTTGGGTRDGHRW